MTTIQWRREIERSSRARGHDLDPGVLEELAIHAQTSYDAARADGLSVGEAHERVRLEIDALTSEAQHLRPRPGPRPGVLPPRAPSSTVVGLIQDVRYGARLTVHRPGATVVSMLTIALGIAATTTLFGLAYGVLLRPLPWPDADRLVRVTETRRDATRAIPFLSNVTYNAWNEKPSTIEDVAGYLNRAFVLDGTGGSLEQVQGVAVTPSLFPLLRATPRLGRVFDTPDEDAVLVSERFARRRFPDSASAVGQRLRLGAADGIPIGPARRDATIVGVMPDDFAFPDPDVDLWVPFAVRPTTKDGSLAIFLAIARLQPGVTVEQAAAEATARGRSAPDPGLVGVGIFGGGGPAEVRLEPWLDSLTGPVKPGLLVLLAAVALLLLAAVGSLTNVQLARAAGRRRELAIRASLGAGRLRLARQLLVESVIVASAGGAIGLLLTSWLYQVLPSWMPADFPRLNAVSFDPTIVGVGAGLALVTGLLVGILPASQAGRLNLVSVLSEDGQAPVGHSRRSPVARARALIIVGQVAVSVLLLVGAGLLGRTLLHLAAIDRGYDSTHLVTGRVISAVPATTRTGLPGLGQLVERLAALPGVSGVAVATALPMPSTGEATMAMRLDADEDHPTPVEIHAKQRRVSAGYFDTLAVPIVAGRPLAAGDAERPGPTPVVVNETFARRYLPPGRPLGPLGRGSDGTPFLQIVGVAGDVPPPTGAPAEPELFAPLGDLDRAVGQPVLFVRTNGDPARFIPTIRRLTRDVSPNLGVDGVMTMDVRLANTIASPRLFALVALVLAVFALLIAVVGLFGVLSYAVAQRRREIGVRSALGATPGRIVRMVVGQGLGLAVAGTVVGLAAAGLLARSVSALLYGVTPFDLLTFAAAPLLLLTAAGLACFLPARRATQIDPLRALRQG